jgi:hypothetical protein
VRFAATTRAPVPIGDAGSPQQVTVVWLGSITSLKFMAAFLPSLIGARRRLGSEAFPGCGPQRGGRLRLPRHQRGLVAPPADALDPGGLSETAFQWPISMPESMAVGIRKSM